jgi:aryl carrier-like protein
LSWWDVWLIIDGVIGRLAGDTGLDRWIQVEDTDIDEDGLLLGLDGVKLMEVVTRDCGLLSDI